MSHSKAAASASKRRSGVKRVAVEHVACVRPDSSQRWELVGRGPDARKVGELLAARLDEMSETGSGWYILHDYPADVSDAALLAELEFGWAFRTRPKHVV